MRLRCKGSHPDPNKRGQCCNYPLASPPAGTDLQFLRVVQLMPEKEDDHWYFPCKRKHCRAVNVYRVAALSKVA